MVWQCFALAVHWLWCFCLKSPYAKNTKKWQSQETVTIYWKGICLSSLEFILLFKIFISSQKCVAKIQSAFRSGTTLLNLRFLSCQTLKLSTVVCHQAAERISWWTSTLSSLVNRFCNRIMLLKKQQKGDTRKKSFKKKKLLIFSLFISRKNKQIELFLSPYILSRLQWNFFWYLPLYWLPWYWFVLKTQQIISLLCQRIHTKKVKKHFLKKVKIFLLLHQVTKSFCFILLC